MQLSRFMLVIVRAVYVSAALLAIASGVLVTASLFIPDRAPRSLQFLGISLVVSAVFLCVGLLLFGIQGRVAGIAAAVRGQDGDRAPALASHVRWLLAYLLAGGLVLGVALGFMTYAILARIDQGFAVFG